MSASTVYIIIVSIISALVIPAALYLRRLNRADQERLRQHGT